MRKDLRIDHDDVRHGHESGQPGEELDADGGVVFAKMKYPLEQVGVPRKRWDFRLWGEAASNAKSCLDGVAG